MVKYLLGIDAGLTNIKVVLFDFKGTQIAVSKKHHETISPRTSWVEGDPEILWKNTADGINEAIQKAGIGVGIFKDYEDASHRAVRIKSIFQPKPENTDKYLERYEDWNILLEALIPAWEKQHMD